MISNTMVFLPICIILLHHWCHVGALPNEPSKDVSVSEIDQDLMVDESEDEYARFRMTADKKKLNFKEYKLTTEDNYILTLFRITRQ